MAPPSTLRDEPLGQGAIHLCVDMQRLFLPGTPWGLDWMPRVLPRIVSLCEPAPEATVFTRFIPARHPGEGLGVWARYWRHWASMTLEAMPPETVDLVPELASFAPPATVVDKSVYSPWLGSDLHARLRARGSERYGQHVENRSDRGGPRALAAARLGPRDRAGGRTADQRPEHRPVLPRREAGGPAEQRAEEGAVLVADGRRDLLRGEVAGLEHALAGLDPQVLDMADQAVAGRRPEPALQAALGDAGRLDRPCHRAGSTLYSA
ncbi:MAG TPA: isochorismatase family protein, partial [Amaricoccus sp.]|nr:isochorismatase family protein [Amaricoccus sp.]